MQIKGIDFLKITEVIILLNVIVFSIAFFMRMPANSQAQSPGSCEPRPWPNGHYCILRSGPDGNPSTLADNFACPAGFTGSGDRPVTIGRVCLDTEDSSPNDNFWGVKTGDVLPGGGYCGGSAVMFRLCCK